MEKETPKYWMSLEQWRNDPEFKELVEREFLTSPFAPEDANSSIARRDFLKLMGASLALTSFGCVRRQAQKIVPYVKRPEDIVPGIANYYASTVFDGNEVFGVVVTTREGRPIQLEGNELHPANKGGMSARAHSVLLNLYDPDRLTEAKQNLLNSEKTNRDTVGISWEKIDEKVITALKAGRAAMLTSSLNSPSTRSLVKQFTQNFSMQHYTWEALNQGSAREAQKKCYGQEVLPRPCLKKSKFTLSLGADFLGTYLSPTEFTKEFSSTRKPGSQMSKLVVFEPTLTLTGANADQRFRVRASQLANAVMGLAYQIVIAQKKSSFVNVSGAREALEPFAEVYKDLGIDKEAFVKVASELWDHRGESLVMTGGVATQTAQAVELNIAVNFLNSVLENDGKTIDYKNANFFSYQGRDQDLSQLVADIESGKILTLVVYGTNPIYSAPASLKLVQAFKKLENLIYVGTHMDETALMANFVATEHHSLENWGDAEVQGGVMSLQQPTIEPLYNTRSFEDSLLKWAQLSEKTAGGLGAESWYKYLESRWQKVHSQYRGQGLAATDFEEFWFKLKQEGVFDVSKERHSDTPARTFNIAALNEIKNSKASGYEWVSYESVALRDGSLANVSWLQEFSDPVTRISWDNYLCVSPKMASKENLKEGQVVKFKIGGTERELPVHIQPGQHDDVIAAAIGYGRTAAGQVGNGVGVAIMDMSTINGQQFVHSGLPVTLSKTDKSIPLANVQGHHSMEGRQIVVESTLDQYNKAPDKVVHKHKILTLWNKHEYTGHKWGMSIDLNSCVGCGTCTIACQSENNIPTVGKKYMLQGREMTWIRIDRYYVGEPNEPDTVFQPMPCLHCDNAPCETVCPVAATVHGEEGTNDMIYNRCVGTRYCANNCPYKVRRFNWFDYTNIASPLHMALNPEVAVRHRGVMEKCTFCIHRIKDKKRQAIAETREFKATDVKTACQQSCPADAIVFGDMNDPESEVSQAFKEVRTYSLLEELNTVPAVRYRYKVRNTKQLKGGNHHGHDQNDKGGHHS